MTACIQTYITTAALDRAHAWLRQQPHSTAAAWAQDTTYLQNIFLGAKLLITVILQQERVINIYLIL